MKLKLKNKNFTEDYIWRMAKILKHGYTDYEYPKEKDEAMKAMDLFLQNGIKLVGGRHYGICKDEDGTTFLIQPTSTQIKQIAKLLKKEFNVEAP